jgi:hypothetical protein
MENPLMHENSTVVYPKTLNPKTLKPSITKLKLFSWFHYIIKPSPHGGWAHAMLNVALDYV